MFRRDWVPSVALLIAAGALILLGGVTRDALTAVGFTAAGAGVSRLLDGAQTRRRDRADRIQQRLNDLDETRRLAYMALAVSSAPARPELVATVANALAHHGHDVPIDVAIGHLATVTNGASESESAEWLKQQIQQLDVQFQQLNAEQ